MLFSWELYALLVGALCGAAGWVASRLFRLRGWPVRWVWAASLALSVLLPVLRPAWEALVAGASFGASLPGLEAVPLLSTASGVVASAGRRVGDSAWTGFVEYGLLGLWLLLTAVLVTRRVYARRILARRRERWEPAEVAGVRAFISEDTGPGVVGFLHPALVIPRWVFVLEEEEQRLIVLHELEHRRARDPRLSQLAYALFVLLPWNVALWWQVRRLRLAVEFDCDQRVIRRTGDPWTYGEMLVDAGRRMAVPGVSPFRSYARSNLERRIRSLVRRPPSYAGLRTSGALVGALMLLGTGLWVQPPGEGGGDERRLPAEATVQPTLHDVPPKLVNGSKILPMQAELRQWAAALDLPVNRAVFLVHISSDGDVDRTLVRQSTGDPELDRAVEDMVRKMEFRPARQDGRAVPVWQAYRLPTDAPTGPRE